MTGGLLALLVATVISSLGDSVASFALILDARVEGPAWWVTLVFLAELVPPLLLAPVLGVVVDRLAVKAVFSWAVLAQGTCFAAAALVPGFYARVVLVATANVFAVASSAAVFRMTPGLAGSLPVQRANSLVTGSLSFAMLLGPGVAGTGYAVWGSTALLGANASTFFAVALLVAVSVRVTSTPAAAGVARPFWDRAADGLRVLRAHRTVYLVLGLAAGIVLTTSIEGVAGVYYLNEVSGSEAGYGLLVSAWALGSLPGSLLAGRARWQDREAQLVTGGGLAIALALLVEGLVPHVLVIAVVFLAGGIGNGIHNVGIRSVIHRHVPAQSQASAWAYYSVMVNGLIVTGYLLGTPWGLLPPRGLVVASGVLATAAALYAVLRIRTGDRAVPSPAGSGAEGTPLRGG